ncbi:MAG: sulfate reduction electron transfer complex DsrMKJOP subunit DsrK [Archaeoglobaceae archaeon]
MAEEEEIKIEQKFPSWSDLLKPITEKEFYPGYYHYPARKEDWEYSPLPQPWHEFNPTEKDWHLPEGWKETFLSKFEELLHKQRDLFTFMDICVRCGACADKCHYYIGTGDPKNMPVARAELLRSIYRRYFTLPGKLFGKWAGARDLDEGVIKDLYYYFHQCSQCRRCSLFCPYGIDNAQIVWLGRELLTHLGIGHRFSLISIASCLKSGNHLGLAPMGMAGSLQSATEDIYSVTGLEMDVPVNKPGADILFVAPSGDYFAEPHWFTMMGYIIFFNYLEEKYGLSYTWSTYAGEGGNFGTFYSYKCAQDMNAKIYKEAKRLGVKWIIGGECGHMWRDKHQQMATMNEIPDNLEEPVSPITGTRFDYATSTKMIHTAEFQADLIKNNKLKIDKSRNDHLKVTLHDSCNPARAVGLLEEPRYVIRNCCNNFYEMPDHAIREKTYCCGAGAGLLADEIMPIRMRGGMPRAMALKYVHELYGVNYLTTLCAIDRAGFNALFPYWKLQPPVAHGGLSELLGNAMVLPGEKERDTDLRGNPLKGKE